jgi:hypothetical protein
MSAGEGEAGVLLDRSERQSLTPSRHRRWKISAQQIDPQQIFNILEASRMLTRLEACPLHERGRAGQSL